MLTGGSVQWIQDTAMVLSMLAVFCFFVFTCPQLFCSMSFCAPSCCVVPRCAPASCVCCVPPSCAVLRRAVLCCASRCCGVLHTAVLCCVQVEDVLQALQQAP
jgi:hypothetical protein